jgi:4-hydroxybenzoate polyprenyltransferase
MLCSSLRLSESHAPPYIQTMKIRPALLGCLLLLTSTLAAYALNDTYAREQDVVNLRLGQRVFVDDGTCGAGQIKEVSGAKMTAGGVVASKRCIPRSGPKKK